MVRWSPHSLLALAVLGSILSVTGCSGCSKEREGAAGATAERAAIQSAFTPRSGLVIGEATPRVTPKVTPAAEVEQSENEPVYVSADADPTSGGAPLTVKFRAEATGGPPGLQYRWDFGDMSASSYQLETQHTYGRSGAYTATFSVAGPGVSESQDVDIEVTEEGFDVDIDVDPDIGTAPLTAQFKAEIDDEVPGPALFQWDFGDGARDANNPTNHTYRVPGEYTAAVTVTNGLGQVGRQDVEIQVDAPDEGE